MSHTEATELNLFLGRSGLANASDRVVWTPLPGGVSSDIWRVELPDRIICVKRALPQLRVKAEWLAPVDRNNYEWEWFRFVDAYFPGLVPRPLAHDPELGMLAMKYLPPEEFANWKSELLTGYGDTDFAANVGRTLGRIHAKSAGDEIVKQTFATDDLFFALRIEPYLLATAENHPDLSPFINKVADETLSAKIALVHGDVSPKNILKRGEDPVFLDAETAWYGDPAFDVAFCLNHFLLKFVLLPDKGNGFLRCFSEFRSSYLNEVTWESAAAIDERIRRLLPILFLARVDGKSPVEYLTEDRQKELVRRLARRFIARSDQIDDFTKLFVANWTILWKQLSNQTF